MSAGSPYRRILLKISGEAFGRPQGSVIDPQSVTGIVRELEGARETGAQIGLVVGGGNFVRGRTFAEIEYIQRATADAIGMLATVINGLALQDALEHHGVPARVLSAIPAPGMCEPFDRRRALDHLHQGRVVILTGGTGNSFFTTDTGAALRASEIGAEVLLKATKVDGVFEADPVAHPKARKFDRLSYADVLARQLGVMDLAAVSLCMESRIPVIVFRLATPGNLAAAVRGEPVGTLISAD